MPEYTNTQIGLLVVALLIIGGAAALVAGLLLVVAVLSVYGLPISFVLFLVNAVLHSAAGTAWLGFFNTVAIGYTLGLTAKILNKLFF